MAAAAAAAALQLRPKHRTLHNPSLIYLFSTSSTPSPDPTTDQYPSSTSSQSQSSFSSHFSDVKASLQQQQRPISPFSSRNPTNPSKPSNLLSSSFSRPSKAASLEEICKNLSEFRTRSSVPPSIIQPNSAHSSQNISFQELYKRNVIAKAGESATPNNTESGLGKLSGDGTGRNLSFEAIRESLRQIHLKTEPPQNQWRSGDPMTLSAFKNSLKLKPTSNSGPVIGGTDTLPLLVSGIGELGEKLGKLRPSVEEGKKEGEPL
ncbi:hypothetical protein CMV_006282 [Castanea mollissima]|uniref:Uncharacterized protein n=1 Tax=Castanea mollissima TaxID=60419 RepID=A0A8J4RVQ3_9ROSI|nr:hypothetical protein CMV_006282 [Castanea mollissima]